MAPRPSIKLSSEHFFSSITKKIEKKEKDWAVVPE